MVSPHQEQHLDSKRRHSPDQSEAETQQRFKSVLLEPEFNQKIKTDLKLFLGQQGLQLV